MSIRAPPDHRKQSVSGEFWLDPRAGTSVEQKLPFHAFRLLDSREVRQQGDRGHVWQHHQSDRWCYRWAATDSGRGQTGPKRKLFLLVGGSTNEIETSCIKHDPSNPKNIFAKSIWDDFKSVQCAPDLGTFSSSIGNRYKERIIADFGFFWSWNKTRKENWNKNSHQIWIPHT